MPCDKNTTIRLASVPELNYSINDLATINFAGKNIEVCMPRGMMQISGPSIFKEYYNSEINYEQYYTKDGYFITGDIAEYDPITC